MKIGIIGTGNVGTALARGLSKIDQEVRMGSRHPDERDAPAGVSLGTQREVVRWCEMAVMAVKYVVTEEVVRTIGPEMFEGKILLDPRNALTKDRRLALGFQTSAAEELAGMIPGARVVKAFNTVFARNQDAGRIGDERLSLLVAGDDTSAKEAVMQLGEAIGFEPVDCGPLECARYLEPMAYQLIYLNDRMRMGTQIGYRLVKGTSKDTLGITP